MKQLFTMLFLFFTVIAFAQSTTETEILTLSKKRVQWLLEGKTDSLAALYDDNSITVHGNGLIKTAQEHLNDVKSGRPTYKSIVLGDAAVKDFGTTAVLVGKGVFSISIDGQEMTQRLVFMEVYMKRKGAWKLISRQASQVQ